MVRLATRRAPSRTARYGVGRARTMKLQNLRRAALKKKAVSRKAKTAKMPIEVTKVKAMTNSLNDFIRLRKRNYGANDVVAKRLQTINTAIGREIRKSNFINPTFARQLNALAPALRGVPNVPANLRNNVNTIKKFLKAHSHKGITSSHTKMSKMITPFHAELKRLDTQLNSQIRRAKGLNAQPRVNPILKQRFSALQRKFNTFKSHWVQNLNKQRMHGTRSMNSSSNQIKKNLEEMNRSLNKNLNLLNRYAKTNRNQIGSKGHHIINANSMKNLEAKWNPVTKEHVNFKRDMPRHLDRLRTTKHF
jgi:hypothetical protein